MSRFAAHFAAMLDAGEGITLRPLTHADMPAIVAMFDDPVIADVWGSPPEEIAELIDEPVVWPFVVMWQGEPSGYLQAYHANADDFWQRFGVPHETFGLDMFLTARGRGIGPRMTRALIDHIWQIPETVRVQIDPDPGNAHAVRAYEKAGFIPRGIFPGYEPGEDMLYMTIERA